MPKIKIGKLPAGLKGDEVDAWYADQYEDAYEAELFKQREARRTAEAKAEAAEARITELEGQIPGDDTVLLKGDDVARWKELSALDVGALKASALKGEQVARRAFLAQVAEATGYNAKTFAELVELRGEAIVAEEQKDGSTSYFVEVKGEGDKVDRRPVTEHFEQTYADWLPALIPTDGASRTTLPPVPPASGRLPTAPRPKPKSEQAAFVEKVNTEATRSQNVVAQRFTLGGKA